MPQLKKYQINSIVDAICADITNGAEDTKAKLYDTKEYKNICEAVNKSRELASRIKDQQVILDDLYKGIQRSTTSFNREQCTKAFALQDINSYNYRQSNLANPKIELTLRGYHSVYEDVFSKVTFALLPKDATENLDLIKTAIASEYLYNS